VPAVQAALRGHAFESSAWVGEAIENLRVDRRALRRPAAQPEITSDKTHPPIFPSPSSYYESASRTASIRTLYSDLEKIVMRRQTTTSNSRPSLHPAAIPASLLTHREFSTARRPQHHSQAPKKIAA
jgi:hypothetical protein